MERVRRKDLHSTAQVLHVLPVETQLNPLIKFCIQNQQHFQDTCRFAIKPSSYFTEKWLLPFSSWTTPSSLLTISQKKSVRTVSYPGILA